MSLSDVMSFCMSEFNIEASVVAENVNLHGRVLR